MSTPLTAPRLAEPAQLKEAVAETAPPWLDDLSLMIQQPTTPNDPSKDLRSPAIPAALYSPEVVTAVQDEEDRDGKAKGKGKDKGKRRKRAPVPQVAAKEETDDSEFVRE